MAQPIWSWLYLGVCDGLLFLESWGLVNWSPAFFLYIFLKVWVKTHLFIPFRVSFYLDNFMGTCAFCMWAFIVFLADPQGISLMMLWCSCFFFFLFTFISHLLFRSRICLAIKCSSQNPCVMMQFYFLKFGKRSCTQLNKPSFIKSQGS